MSQITLLLPGLLPRPDEPATLPELPNLGRLLSRANRRLTTPDLTEQLFLLFGQNRLQNQDWPVAAITYLCDFPDHHTGNLMRADPVHLHADMDRLLMFDQDSFELNETEADTLIADINDSYNDAPWRLVRGQSCQRWYLQLDKEYRIQTTPLGNVAGQAIGNALVTGTDKDYWRNLGNEIQMLLFTHPINQARQEQGKLPVNSIWFWGQGVLPEFSGKLFDCVYSTDITLGGLAKLSQCVHIDSLDPIVESGNCLIWPEQFKNRSIQIDWQGYNALLEELDQGLVPRLMTLLVSRGIDSIRLITDGQEFLLDRSALRRFWRRAKLLSSYARGPL